MLNHRKHVVSLFTRSVGLLGLAAAIGLMTPSSLAASDGDSDKLPSPERLLKAAIDAQGGKEAFEAVKSVRTKAELNTPMGKMEILTQMKHSGEFMLRQSNPQMVEMRAGYDGKVGWSFNPMMGGYQLLSDEEIAEIRDMTTTHGIVPRIEDEFGEMRTVEKTTFAGSEAYKVHMKHKDHEREQHAFFDAKNYRLIGIKVEEQTDFGPMEISMAFDGWETRGNLTVFTKMTINQMGMEMVMTITEMEFDNVKDDAFELPEEVKKLAAARTEKEGEG